MQRAAEAIQKTIAVAPEDPFLYRTDDAEPPVEKPAELAKHGCSIPLSKFQRLMLNFDNQRRFQVAAAFRSARVRPSIKSVISPLGGCFS